MQSLDWENAFGVPPVEPVPQLSDITQQYLDSKRNRFRNLVLLMVSLSGLLAINGIIKQGSEGDVDKPAQVSNE